MSIRIPLVVGLTCATMTAAGDVRADDAFAILTEGNMAALCQTLPEGATSPLGGELYVASHELIDLMLDQASTPHAFRGRAAKAADADGDGKTSPLEMARHLIEHRGSDDQAFGTPAPNDSSYAVVQAGWASQVDLLDDDISNLKSSGKGPFWREDRRTGQRDDDVAAVFAADTEFRIRCTGPLVKTPRGGSADAAADIFHRIRLAATTKALGYLDRSERRSDSVLKKVDSAKLSFRDDIENDANVFSIDGAVGYQIPLSDPKGAGDRAYVDLLPYVAYKRQKPGGGAKVQEIHRAAPGLMLGYREYVGRVPFELFFSGESQFDIEQRSEQLVANASLSPAFVIGDRGTTLLAQPIPMFFGALDAFPDLDANLRFAHVLDAGQDADLESGNGYLGVGGDVSVSFSLTQPKGLSDISLKFSYDHLEFVAGKIDRNRASRFGVALTYQFPEFPNLTGSISYEDGQDMATFQDEEAFQVTVGLRF